MSAVSTHVLRALRMTGEKARGDTLTSDEQVECLAELNSMLDSWALERLMCYQIVQESLALTTSTASYTIGSGGAFNTTRPVKIVDPCFIRDSSNLDTPVRLIGAEQYGRIVQKSAGYTYPTDMFYDSGFSATSTATLYLYPSPSASLTLFINSWKAVGTFSTMSQTVSLPPGYQLAIESNYAIHSAAGLTPVSAELAKIARDSKAAIKSVNLPDTVSRLDAGIVRGRRSNIFLG